MDHGTSLPWTAYGTTQLKRHISKQGEHQRAISFMFSLSRQTVEQFSQAHVFLRTPCRTHALPPRPTLQGRTKSLSLALFCFSNAFDFSAHMFYD